MELSTMMLIGAVILFVIYVFSVYNSFVKLQNEVEEAFATMDVYLKKRWDLIPNIVETVKGYAKHEKDTLVDIISSRNGTYDSMSLDSKIKANEEMNLAIPKMMALAERYPELKANQNFLSLNNELSKIESEIAQSRKYYNAIVRNYNNKVEMIPSNIVAKLFGYKVKPMFKVNENERENVEIKF